MSEANTHQSAPSSRYSLVAIGLHWVLGLALVGLFVMGSFMADLPISPLRLKLYNWHKWAGMTVLLLSALRLVWRITHRPPALPDEIQQHMPAWQQRAHHATQHTMYALFFVVPVVGWAYSSAAGFPIVVFGLIPLPDFVPADKALAELIKPWHEITAYALAALVLLHVAAALKHQWWDKHALLQRMLPSKSH
jgi:cytochrome b561